MALKPCKECGKEVSTTAASCPHCGKKNPNGSQSIAGVGCLLIILLVVIGGLMTDDTPKPSPSYTAPAAPAPAPPPAAAQPNQPASSTFPGVNRVGDKAARRLWNGLRSTPGFRKLNCASQMCIVQFDPATWNMMEYDLKRDVTAGIGIGTAYGAHSDYTEIRDAYTGKELASYSASSDRARVK